MIELKQGPIFSCANPDAVADFLRGRRLETLEVSAEDLHIFSDGSRLFLNACGDRVRDFPLREAFFLKVLRWFNFPRRLLPRLDIETVTAILNDLLLNIRSGDVTVTIEDGDALTITSAAYNDLSDLEVLSLCAPIGIESVSRNDFFLRVYSRTRCETEPTPGDVCSFSYNVVNSETGFRALSLNHFIFRYFCSNGAVVPIRGDEKKVHYGGKQGDLFRFLDRHLAGGDEIRERIIEQLRQSVSTLLNGERDSVIPKLDALLGKGAGQRLLRSLPGNASRYDLFNAITEKAKDYNIGIRLQLESIAGSLMCQ